MVVIGLMGRDNKGRGCRLRARWGSGTGFGADGHVLPGLDALFQRKEINRQRRRGYVGCRSQTGEWDWSMVSRVMGKMQIDDAVHGP